MDATPKKIVNLQSCNQNACQRPAFEYSSTTLNETGLQVIHLTVNKESARESREVGAKYHAGHGLLANTMAYLNRGTKTRQTPADCEEHQSVEYQRREATVVGDFGYRRKRAKERSFLPSAFVANGEDYGANQKSEPEDGEYGDDDAIAVVNSAQAQEKKQAGATDG